MRLSTKEYKRRKESLMKTLRIGESEYVELIKGDYHTGASRVAAESIGKFLKEVDASPNLSVNVLGRDVTDDWDFVWYYKRNLHVVLPEVVAYTFDANGVDCNCIDEIDKDVDIDTVLPTREGPKVTYIRVIKRNIPVRFSKSVCNCTIQIMHGDFTRLRYHFMVSDRVRKIFIETLDECKGCDKCTRVNTVDGIECVLRPRFREVCSVSDRYSDAFGVLGIIANVINVYNKREKISRQRKITPESEIMRSVMVAHEDDIERDTERIMPMFDYVREYHESVKQEYKGGHHASPVSHPRSGYFRKCKHGTHILVDGEFVEVGRGLGKYIYTRPTIVNANKDSTLAEML